MGSAKALRDFIAPLIRDAGKQIIFIQFINFLEDQGIYCCRDLDFVQFHNFLADARQS